MNRFWFGFTESFRGGRVDVVEIRKNYFGHTLIHKAVAYNARGQVSEKIHRNSVYLADSQAPGSSFKKLGLFDGFNTWHGQRRIDRQGRVLTTYIVSGEDISTNKKGILEFSRMPIRHFPGFPSTKVEIKFIDDQARYVRFLDYKKGTPIWDLEKGEWVLDIAQEFAPDQSLSRALAQAINQARRRGARSRSQHLSFSVEDIRLLHQLAGYEVYPIIDNRSSLIIGTYRGKFVALNKYGYVRTYDRLSSQGWLTIAGGRPTVSGSTKRSYWAGLGIEHAQEFVEVVALNGIVYRAQSLETDLSADFSLVGKKSELREIRHGVYGRWKPFGDRRYRTSFYNELPGDEFDELGEEDEIHEYSLGRQGLKMARRLWITFRRELEGQLAYITEIINPSGARALIRKAVVIEKGEVVAEGHLPNTVFAVPAGGGLKSFDRGEIVDIFLIWSKSRAVLPDGTPLKDFIVAGDDLRLDSVSARVPLGEDPKYNLRYFHGAQVEIKFVDGRRRFVRLIENHDGRRILARNGGDVIIDLTLPIFDQLMEQSKDFAQTHQEARRQPRKRVIAESDASRPLLGHEELSRDEVLRILQEHDLNQFEVLTFESEEIQLALLYLWWQGEVDRARQLEWLVQRGLVRAGPIRGFLATILAEIDGETAIVLSNEEPGHHTLRERMMSLVHESGAIVGKDHEQNTAEEPSVQEFLIQMNDRPQGRMPQPQLPQDVSVHRTIQIESYVDVRRMEGLPPIYIYRRSLRTSLKINQTIEEMMMEVDNGILRLTVSGEGDSRIILPYIFVWNRTGVLGIIVGYNIPDQLSDVLRRDLLEEDIATINVGPFLIEAERGPV
ncbi:MAG: hypothetical protein NUV91_10590, partial [Candidatus Omnitrophica bacterium]|nr:hypothetical protein [Candidatus Omnitrophota bacterium]